VKHYLKRISDEGPSLPPEQELGWAHGLAAICFALVLIHFGFRLALTPCINYILGHAMIFVKKFGGHGAAFWGMPSDMHQSTEFVEDLVGYLQVSAGSIMILWLFPKVSNRLPLANWLVLLNVYAFRCLVVRSQFARIIDGFDFTMIGLANYFLGLYYRRTIGKYMARYWFFVLFVFALLIAPGTYGRSDESAIENLSFRIRYHLVELAMAVLLLCAGERIAASEIFTEDKLEWLSWWALYVFLFHRFIHIVVPHPLNWIALILLAPIAWAIHGGAESTSSQPADVPTEDDATRAERALPSQQADVERALQEDACDAGRETDVPSESDKCCPDLMVSQIEGR